VLRLVYYSPNDTSVDLLATNPATLPEALESVLSDSEPYDRVLWLEANRPVWKAPTASEADTIRDNVNQLLSTQYRPVERRELVGTMDLDRFSLRVYAKEG